RSSRRTRTALPPSAPPRLRIGRRPPAQTPAYRRSSFASRSARRGPLRDRAAPGSGASRSLEVRQALERCPLRGRDGRSGIVAEELVLLRSEVVELRHRFGSRILVVRTRVARIAAPRIIAPPSPVVHVIGSDRNNHASSATATGSTTLMIALRTAPMR